jgi:hypothetical protein
MKSGVGAVVVVCLAGCMAAAPSVSSAEEPPSAPVSSVEAPSASAVDTPTPTAAPTLSPSVAPTGPLALRWSSATFPGRIASLIGDGARFVAVGRAGDTWEDPHGAWTSTDGRSWTAHAVPIASLDEIDAQFQDQGPDFASRRAGMGQLVRLDDTVFSIGSFSINDGVRPVGWRWTDGGAWQAITSSSPYYEQGIPEDVISGEGALVAARMNVGITYVGADSTVWTWRPDTSWVQGDLSVNDNESIVITDLAWAEGTFLAVGFVSAASEEETTTITAWTSSDGATWTRIDPPEGGRELCDVQPHPSGGFVALGVEADRSVAWTWDVGAGWAGGSALPGAPGHEMPGASPFRGLCQLLHLGGRIVAVASVDESTRLWSSIDGLNWSTVEGVSGSGQDAAAIADRIVLATVDVTGDGDPMYTVHTATAAP